MGVTRTKGTMELMDLRPESVSTPSQVSMREVYVLKPMLGFL
jgi:hypothetical protein